MKIHIDTLNRTPIYRQLVDKIKHSVKNGSIKPGEMLPSMNELAAKEGISRETVKKAYAILSKEGVIVPKQGKGFFIAEPNPDGRKKVLVIFDKFSVYKQVIFSAFEEVLGSRADITVLTHNQSLDLLKYYLDSHLDDFDWYVVSPHFALDEQSQKQAVKLLSRIPNRKLIMLDRWISEYPGNYGAVYQDFENDVYDGLLSGVNRPGSSKDLSVITLPKSLYGQCIHKGLERFAKDFGVHLKFMTAPPETISKGDTFLVLNSQLDWGLASLARRIGEQGLEIGKDVFIISYNDFALNDVVLGGLTTISTDFAEMGRLAAQMIITGKLEKVHCPFRMNRRHTF